MTKRKLMAVLTALSLFLITANFAVQAQCKKTCTAKKSSMTTRTCADMQALQKDLRVLKAKGSKVSDAFLKAHARHLEEVLAKCHDCINNGYMAKNHKTRAMKGGKKAGKHCCKNEKQRKDMAQMVKHLDEDAKTIRSGIPKASRNGFIKSHTAHLAKFVAHEENCEKKATGKKNKKSCKKTCPRAKTTVK